MELFSPQPDLSLQISPPNPNPTSNTWTTSPKTDHDHDQDLDFGHFWKRALNSQDHNTSKTTNSPHLITHSSNPNLTHLHNLISHQINTNLTNQNHNLGFTSELGFLKPICGVPVYYNNTTPHDNQHHQSSLVLDSSCTITPPSSLTHANNITQSRFLSKRFLVKRNMRTPRMRWTTALHARFVHAVDLLGGHERATPKSVLELMDVKDITLAHVKSHLQMYRTIKTTDHRATTSADHVHVHGSSRDVCDDILLDIRNLKRTDSSVEHEGSPKGHLEKDHQNGLWSNSSSMEAWLHGKHKDSQVNIPSLKEETNAKGNYERLQDVITPNHFPMNLEFTLGRPQY